MPARQARQARPVVSPQAPSIQNELIQRYIYDFIKEVPAVLKAYSNILEKVKKRY